jgi:O-antigen/teichoic acid export membrane protein
MSDVAFSEPETPGISEPVQERPRIVRLPFLSSLRLGKLGYSSADQVLAIGGMFVVNLALARARSKDEYGIFTLSYSVFTLLAGLHSAAILEPYTIYGAGRYRGSFREYAGFLWRRNGWLAMDLTALLVSLWAVLHWLHPAFASYSLLGLAMTAGVLLSAAFLRRTFYIRRRPDLALRFSAAFFVSCMGLLALSMRFGLLNGLSAFVIAAVGWVIATLFVAAEYPGRNGNEDASDFLQRIPGYWSEHWKYSRWALITALVFQFTAQAYFWVVAIFLSLKDVAQLRAMYNLTQPVEQGFVAITLLVLPQMAAHFAAGESEKLRQMWRQCSFVFFGLSSVFALVVGLESLRLLHLVYGGKFDEGGSLLRWYVMLPVVMGLGHAANAALKATERPKAVFYAYVTSGATTFLLGIPLVIRWGLRGAVFGMLLSGVSYAVVLTFSFYKVSRSQMAEMQAVSEVQWQ